MIDLRKRKVAIIGSVGIPANYGGFETLVENLAVQHSQQSPDFCLEVYCSLQSYQRPRSEVYLNTKLRYIPIPANGIYSIFYDGVSLISAILSGCKCICLLGVSGAIFLPITWLFPSVKVVTNLDGIEWRRNKWSKMAKLYLRFSEKMAVLFSDSIIADNEGIVSYLKSTYNITPLLVAYGGDHAIGGCCDPKSAAEICKNLNLPENYALALCRIEPENNIEVILEAWSTLEFPLVFIGNWNNSEFGRSLREKYENFKNIHILDPIYSLSTLKSIRERARLYVHGHSVGGTNPSLVEMMHFGLPIVAWDCEFNKYTTNNEALYFSSVLTLQKYVYDVFESRARSDGDAMKRIAIERFTWSTIGKKYFEIFDRLLRK